MSATTDGESWGDPELAFFFRSPAKPIQAIPFVEGYDDLGDDEIAIACASHHAEPAQLDAVRKVLARAGATVDDLENGLQEGRPDGKLGHNCSGKHAGHARRLPRARLAAPSVPRSSAPAAAADRRAARRRARSAVDGCGVRRSRSTLAGAAELLTRTPQRIRAAMRARPELVGGSTRRGRHRPDAAARRLDREGRRRRALLRSARRRARRCAQGRGRRVPRDRPGACASCSGSRSSRRRRCTTAAERSWGQ